MAKETRTTTRRDFIKSGVYLAVSGVGALLVPSFLSGLEEDRNKREKILKIQKSARIDPNFEPPYLKLHRSGELKKRAKELWDMMAECRLCPRECGANRLKGDEGFCQASAKLEISSFHPHYGEETPLVGTGGSGTIFLTNCNLRCAYCINWEINHKGIGQVESINSFAGMMIKLQKRGCHNINFVTPTHYSPHILMAVDAAASQGLRLPLVYNTSGWERLEVLKKLDGIVDIYLPDFKYAESKMADKYSSGADTYPGLTKKAHLEMQRQVGTAKPAKDGLMYRGLMIRHLVLPNRVSGSKYVFAWIGKNLPKDTYINVMSQYTPVYKALDYPKIARRITREEYNEALKWAKEAGLTNVHAQRIPLRF
ncbi:MAG: radical SAM protein [Candidatus Aminicenantes bacterium]|nr:MAG: radical SAM protein [Candidatus Aminicenantes bacterium]